MAISIAWLLDKLGNKLYAWSTTKAVMDFDRGGGSGQTLEKTLNDGLIQEYTCVTQGITHALTGTGNNIKFVADAPFNEGDTITVNGSLVSAYTQDGEALTGGAWNTGMTVVCYLDGSTLNFKGGGGSVTVEGLSADVVLTGNTVSVSQGNNIIQEIDGELDVLMFGALRNRYRYFVMWNGSSYNTDLVEGTRTVGGTIKRVVVLNVSGAMTAFGLNITTSPSTVQSFSDGFSNNNINFSLSDTFVIAVLGTK